MRTGQRKFAGPTVAVLISVVLSACSTYHYHVNTQATRHDSATGYQFENLTQNDNSDDLFICLAFSGGGTRAAAFSFGVLQELKNTQITINGKLKSLLDEVDCISGISGGSFTAAYYGLYRDRIFQDFQPRFLDKDIESMLKDSVAFNPYNWIRLMSTTFDRIDLAVELYDKEVFDHKTVGDMAIAGRPYILINATNLEDGSRFSFTQMYFDALGSTLVDYPVAMAVAASSAFPFLLSPISLANFPKASGYTPPGWFNGVLESTNSDRARLSAATSLQYYLDDKQHKFIHLMDGGLSDNIGVRSLIDEYRRGFIAKGIREKKIDKLVFIIVNAKTEPKESHSKHEERPNLPVVAYKTSTISMDNYSYETISVLTEALTSRLQAQKDLQACKALLQSKCPAADNIIPLGKDIDPYIIELNFENIHGMADEDQQYYLELPTSFALKHNEVEKLINIGPKLMKKNEQYQCLLQVLAAQAAHQPRPSHCPQGAGIHGKEN